MILKLIIIVELSLSYERGGLLSVIVVESLERRIFQAQNWQQSSTSKRYAIAISQALVRGKQN